MPKNPTNQRKAPTVPELTAHWTAAPRNPAWDDLWRRILSEAVFPALRNQPAPDGRHVG